MEFTLNIKCDALVEAINRFCDIMEGKSEKSATKPEPESKKPAKEKTKPADDEEDEEEEETEQTKPEPKNRKSAKAAAKEETKPAEEDEDEEGEESEISREEVRAALAKLSKSKGKEVVKDILAEFGAAKLTEVDPEDYGELIKAIKGV